MAVSTTTSLLVSSTLIFLLFASMQLFKVQLASNEIMTITGGFLGSILFVLTITAIGNLEKILFGAGFQMKLIPEIVPSLMFAMFISGTIHRVCVTTCLIFSLIALYYINGISQSMYAAPTTTVTQAQIKKRK